MDDILKNFLTIDSINPITNIPYNMIANYITDYIRGFVKKNVLESDTIMLTDIFDVYNLSQYAQRDDIDDIIYYMKKNICGYIREHDYGDLERGNEENFVNSQLENTSRLIWETIILLGGSDISIPVRGFPWLYKDNINLKKIYDRLIPDIDFPEQKRDEPAYNYENRDISLSKGLLILEEFLGKDTKSPLSFDTYTVAITILGMIYHSKSLDIYSIFNLENLSLFSSREDLEDIIYTMKNETLKAFRAGHFASYKFELVIDTIVFLDENASVYLKDTPDTYNYNQIVENILSNRAVHRAKAFRVMQHTNKFHSDDIILLALDFDFGVMGRDEKYIFNTLV